MENERQRALAAAGFAEKWKNRGYERGDSQTFWLTLLHDVYGVEHPEDFIRFEERLKMDKTSYVDGFIAPTRVLIEQKSADKNLRLFIRQSDGTKLTPYQQALRYIPQMPLSQHPRWVVTCNFWEFLVYDMEFPNAAPFQVALEDLPHEFHRLAFLADTGSTPAGREERVSMQAGEIVGRLYDGFRALYIAPDAPATLHSLNVLCVRLVFCLYAEDAGVFGRHNMFHDYLAAHDTASLRDALLALFRTLDTPTSERSPYLRPDLSAFPYTNGGLFSEAIDVPQFTPELRTLLLDEASLGFDWSEISPTIFGAVFESTLNPVTRRSGGMHYTSITHIHRLIGPLFLDRLTKELEEALVEHDLRRRKRRLNAWCERAASLRFLDPACGSGNFLTETYLALRRLENRALATLSGGQGSLPGFGSPVRVSIGQFYGIEVNDFAVTVAQTALWISEAQILIETERIVKRDIDFLPLRTYTHIREGNALHTDWAELLGTEGADYIIGNPPFVGARMKSADQAADMAHVFGEKWPGLGNMDYVCAWYKRAADYMLARPKDKPTETAFVSTSSIAQGEQVAALWKPLMASGVNLRFARRSFRWDNEASAKAHVYCVIIGFGAGPSARCRLYEGEECREVARINAYLTDGPDAFVAPPKPTACRRATHRHRLQAHRRRPLPLHFRRARSLPARRTGSRALPPPVVRRGRVHTGQTPLVSLVRRMPAATAPADAPVHGARGTRARVPPPKQERPHAEAGRHADALSRGKHPRGLFSAHPENIFRTAGVCAYRLHGGGRIGQRQCVPHARSHALAFRRVAKPRTQRLVTGRRRTKRGKLPLLQGYRVQQLSVARADGTAARSGGDRSTGNPAGKGRMAGSHAGRPVRSLGHAARPAPRPRAQRPGRGGRLRTAVRTARRGNSNFLPIRAMVTDGKPPAQQGVKKYFFKKLSCDVGVLKKFCTLRAETKDSQEKHKSLHDKHEKS